MSTPEAPAPTCPSCGGPDDGEFAICKFCKRAYSAEIAESAIPCPRCRVPCRWGKQKCGACASWLVVSCVFCGALSPYNQSACLSCHEGFAGAPARKAQRDAAARQQHEAQTFGVVGNVAASFLGAVAGSAIGGSFGGYHGHYHPSWDSSSGSYGGGSGDGPPIGSVGGDVSGGGFSESGGTGDSSSDDSSSDDSSSDDSSSGDSDS
jgi:hypothetical protein